MDAYLKTHAEHLGRLVGNMQSLEFLLRTCLLIDKIDDESSIPNYHKLVQGNIVQKNAFTNYDDLRKLIQKHNKIPMSKGLTIDETLVDIRDAIAHGRISSHAPPSPPRLLKFEKPCGDKVEVKFSVLMTEEWFREQINRFREAILKVNEVYERQQAKGA